MDNKEEEFLKRLQAAFKMEANERLQSMSSGLAEVEKADDSEAMAAAIEIVFREAHSLKGAARAVNMSEVEMICQALESVFASLKQNEPGISSKLIDVLYNSLDCLEKLIAPPEDIGEGFNKDKIPELIQQLNKIAAGESRFIDDKNAEAKEAQPEFEKPVEPAKQETVEKSPIEAEPLTQKTDEEPELSQGEEEKPETQATQPSVSVKKQQALSQMVRISTSKLDAMLLQAEEMLTIKTGSHQMISDLSDVSAMLDSWKNEWAKYKKEVRELRTEERQTQIRIDASIAPQKSKYGKILDFLDWNYDYMKSIESKIATAAKYAKNDHNSTDIMIDTLLDDMKKVLMLPFSWLLEIFPKLVRDLARDQGKEVELEIHGSEVEVDRRILEGMKDPLIHLLRNCVDHGIESPDERKSRNKQTRGKITMSIKQADGKKVEIRVNDDGRGIDAEKVKNAAVKQGIIRKEEACKLKNEDAFSLIFQSKVSTSSIITDISGRGLGLAILRENVKNLGGKLSVNSTLGKGSLFYMELPLTVATFRGIFIESGGQIFVAPTVNVERIVRIKKSEIKTTGNKETAQIDGRQVSIVSLADVLGFQASKSAFAESGQNSGNNGEYAIALIIADGDNLIAFNVDNVIDEDEVLIKAPGKQFSRIKNILGMTVFRTGKPIAILNVNDLVKSAVNASGILPASGAGPEEIEAKKKSILIAEDSITSRMLLKNILEFAGYNVKATVDGADAFTNLKEGEYDLVVSDVEMPRMNGFDLTAKIRDDKNLSELPVILVTGLGSSEHRERGIDVGANAYIVKSDFDQSNLIDAIERLI